MASLASTVPRLQRFVRAPSFSASQILASEVLVQGCSFISVRGKEALELAVDLGLAGVMSVDINGREYLMTQAWQRGWTPQSLLFESHLIKVLDNSLLKSQQVPVQDPETA